MYISLWNKKLLKLNNSLRAKAEGKIRKFQSVSNTNLSYDYSSFIMQIPFIILFV